MRKVNVDFNNLRHDYGNNSIPIYSACNDIPPEDLIEGTRLVLCATGEMEADAILHFNKDYNVWVGEVIEGTRRYNLYIEADASLTRKQLQQALIVTGITSIIEKIDGLIASSNSSNLEIESWENVLESALKTKVTEKHQPDTNWKVNTRIHLRQNSIGHHISDNEINIFLHKLAEVSDAYFIYSNDYYCTEAIRDSRGLHFV